MLKDNGMSALADPKVREQLGLLNPELKGLAGKLGNAFTGISAKDATNTGTSHIFRGDT